jgi:hypothetical protein
MPDEGGTATITEQLGSAIGNHISRTSSNQSCDKDLVVLKNRSLFNNFTSSKLGTIRYFYALFACSLLFVGVLAVCQYLRIAVGIEPIPVGVLLSITGALLAGFLKLYDIGEKRLGTVDLFANDILSIIRVLSAKNTTESLVRHYENPTLADYPDTARREDYLGLFGSCAKDLGFLPRTTIAQVTAFYTFLKAARDTRGTLSAINQTKTGQAEYVLDKEKQDILLNTMYLMFLCLEAGYYALLSLEDDKAEFAKYDPMLKRKLSQTSKFLKSVLPPDDPRRMRLEIPRRIDLLYGTA